MENSKPLYLSRGVIGGVVAAACGIASLFGYVFPEDTQALIADNLFEISTAVGTIIGGALAVYGRIRATKRLK